MPYSSQVGLSPFHSSSRTNFISFSITKLLFQITIPTLFRVRDARFHKIVQKSVHKKIRDNFIDLYGYNRNRSITNHYELIIYENIYKYIYNII